MARRSCVLLLICTSLLAILAVTASAQTNWVGTDGSWFIGSNWSSGSVPTSGQVRINNGGTVHINNATATAGTVYTGFLNPSVNRLLVENGGVLSGIDSLIAGRAGAVGHVTVTGQGSRITMPNNGEVTIGEQTDGSLTIENGGRVDSSYGKVGWGITGVATATITGANSTWNVNNQLFIGYQAGANGTLNLLNGGVVNITGNQNLVIGHRDGSTGLMTVSGGQYVLNRQAVLGNDAGARGTARVTGPGSAWTTSADFVVGYSGIGTLEVLDRGAFNAIAEFQVANHTGSTGNVTVSGTGSTLTFANSIIPGIGLAGSGSVRVENGGAVSSTGTLLGANAGSQGAVTITGTGSRWNSIGFEVGGGSGTGTVQVVAGGLLDLAGSMFIASGDNSTGSVTLSGIGSQIVTDTGVTVGHRKTGTLTITDGAIFTCNDSLSLGHESTGNGTLNLNLTPGGGYGNLVTNSVLEGSGTGKVNFDGGVFQARTGPMNVLSGFEPGDVTIQAGGALINSNGFDITIPVALGGVGELSKIGQGTLSLSAVNSFTGGTYIEAGTLRAQVAGAFVNNTPYTLFGGTLDLNGFNLTMSSLSGMLGAIALGNATLTVAPTSNIAYSGPISGAGVLTKQGTGTLTLSGTNNYSGGTNVDGGVLSVFSDANLGNSAGALTMSGGTLRTTAGFTLNRPTAINAAGGTYDVASGTLIQQGLLSGSGQLTKIGTGTLSLPGSSGYNGVITVNQGTFTKSGGFASINGVHVSDSGTDGSGNVVITDNALLLAANFFTVGDNLTGVGPGGTGALTISNGGTLGLNTGAKLTLGWINGTGTLNLNAGGTLQANGYDGIQQHATGTAHFNFAGGKLQVFDLSTSIGMTLSGTTSTVEVNGSEAVLSGTLSGSGSLTKSGGGALTLGVTNGYSGGTIVNGGQISRMTPSAFPTNTPYQVNGGTLDLNDMNLVASSLSGAGGTVDLGSGDLTVNQTSDTTFAGSIVGDGGLTKSGAGRLTLSSPATNYTGATSIQDGTLQITNNIGFNSPIDMTASGALSLNIAQDVKLLQGISGPGPVSVTGTAMTARLAGNDSGFTGTFTLPGGTRGMMWSSANAGSAAAIWDISGQFGFIETGAGNSTVQLGGLEGDNPATQLAAFGGSGLKTFEVGALGTDTTLAGSIKDASTFGGGGTATVALTKVGTGTLILTNANTYTGGTTVNAGTLLVNGSIAGAASAADGATLGGSGTIGGLITIQQGATLAPGASPGRLTCAAGISLDGTLEIEITGSAPDSGYDQLRLTGGDVILAANALLDFPAPSGTFASTDRLYIVDNTGSGAITGAFAGLPDGGANGTAVSALAALGGFAEWRIYYNADSSTGALTGGNDIAVAPYVAACSCPGDIDSDGRKSGLDVEGLVNCLMAGGNCSCADMNGTDGVTVADVGPFITTLLSGDSCP